MIDAHAAPHWFRKAVTREARESSMTFEGREIRYRIWGDGAKSPVVLIHGGAAHSHWWDHIAPLLARDRRVIAFDLSGHGDSDHHDAYSVTAWAGEALAIADRAGSESPILIGHSLGGVVALQAAIVRGEELGGVVIVDSPIFDFTPEDGAAADRLAFGPPRLYPSREAVVSRFRPIPDQETIGYIREHVAGTSVREVPGGWSWKFDPRIFDRAPELPQLVPLRCRSALIRGENGIVSAEMAAAIFDGLGRDTAMIDVPDAGHHLMLDQPLALVTGLRGILAAWDLAADG